MAPVRNRLSIMPECIPLGLFIQFHLFCFLCPHSQISTIEYMKKSAALSLLLLSCTSVTSVMNLRNLAEIKARHHLIQVEYENFHSLL